MVTRNLTSPLTPVALRRSVTASNADFLPRYWPTVYEISKLSKFRDKTARKTLNAIDGLYLFAEAFRGSDDLDELLWLEDADGLKIILDGFFNAERTAPFVTVLTSLSMACGKQFRIHDFGEPRVVVLQPG
jgi:hypothetical protein